MIHNVRRNCRTMNYLSRETRHQYFETRDRKDRIVKDLEIISRNLVKLKENNGIPEPSNLYNVIYGLHSTALFHPQFKCEYHLFYWLTTSLKVPFTGSRLGKFDSYTLRKCDFYLPN